MVRNLLNNKIKNYNAVVFAISAVSLLRSSREFSTSEWLFIMAMTAAFFCTMMVCVVPIHIKKMKAELEQYSDLLKHGALVSGKITFSDDCTLEDDVYRVEGKLRYTLKEEGKTGTVIEITKPTTTTRGYDPKKSAVESVKLVVLPKHPKSGVEATHAKNEIGRLERDLAIICLYA